MECLLWPTSPRAHVSEAYIFGRNQSVFATDHLAARREVRIAEKSDGEDAGADEGGDLCLVAVPAEGDARTLEGSPG